MPVISIFPKLDFMIVCPLPALVKFEAVIYMLPLPADFTRAWLPAPAPANDPVKYNEPSPVIAITTAPTAAPFPE